MVLFLLPTFCKAMGELNKNTKYKTVLEIEIEKLILKGWKFKLILKLNSFFMTTNTQLV